MTGKAKNWRLDAAAAESYERDFIPAIFAEWAPLLVRAGGVAAGDRVLDVACGTGIVARVAADRVGGDGEVTGLDLNASMLEVARRVRPDISWREGDAADLPFEDEAFDVVLCQAALMFFPDRVAALREMRRVLRAGGRLAVQVWGESPGYTVAGEIVEEVAGRETADVFRAPSALSDPARFAALFAAAGFETTSLETHHGVARFSSPESFLRAEIEGWVLSGRVDVGALLDAARDRLAPYCGAGGEVRIPLDGHIVTAPKS